MIYKSLVCFCLLWTLAVATPLDDYVKAPDPHYKYELIKVYELEGYTLYVLNLTSQKWLDETITDKSIWWHFLSVTVPKNLTRPDSAFMVIDGGNNDPNGRLPFPSDGSIALTSLFAVGTGSIAANLEQVPNQPQVFKKDPTQKSRHEDAVIAWTWKTFMENISDPSILLRLPMTKAAYKAMDAITDFASKKGFANIKKFMLAGYSKRGWTTWTTAAVDNERVFAAVPIVMDFLNLNQNLHNHYRSLGGWTFAFGDYYDLNITTYLDTPQLFAMQQIVDPHFYLPRYVNTKLMVVTTSGDEFFIPDDSSYYWKDLQQITNGTVLMRKIPNAEHSCVGHQSAIFADLVSFYLSAYEKQMMPSLKWEIINNLVYGITRVKVDIKNGPRPRDVRIFYAETLDNKRRDFRLVVGDPNDGHKPIPHPVVWKTTTSNIIVNETSDFIYYEASFKYPLSGWFAYYFQFTFPGLSSNSLQVTTETNIIPNIYPFPDCYREECKGKLV